MIARDPRKMPQVTDAESFLAVTRVSRETLVRLSDYESLLLKWQRSINLVSARTLPDLWRRHMLDSAQLVDLAPPEARIWVDLGSGGGFPGLVIAILLRDRPDACVHLIESDRRKCVFLAEVVRATGAPVRVHTARIEEISQSGALGHMDVVTARACAPLDRLLGLAAPFFGPDTIGLFPKGQGAAEELTVAEKCWKLKFNQIASLSDPRATVLKVKGLRRAAA